MPRAAYQLRYSLRLLPDAGALARRSRPTAVVVATFVAGKIKDQCSDLIPPVSHTRLNPQLIATGLADCTGGGEFTLSTEYKAALQVSPRRHLVSTRRELLLPTHPFFRRALDGPARRVNGGRGSSVVGRCGRTGPRRSYCFVRGVLVTLLDTNLLRGGSRTTAPRSVHKRAKPDSSSGPLVVWPLSGAVCRRRW